MSFCLRLSFAAGWVCAALAPHAVAGGSTPTQSSVPVRVRSVVRADSRGRLVRSMVVSAPVVSVPQVQPRLVEAAEVSNPGTAAAAMMTAANASVPDLVESAAKKYD